MKLRFLNMKYSFDSQHAACESCVAAQRWRSVGFGSHGPVEGRKEAAGGQHEGSLRQQRPSVVHPVQVPSGHVSHADGSGRTVQELITVPTADR